MYTFNGLKVNKMKKLIASSFLLIFFFQLVAQNSPVVMIDLQESELKMNSSLDDPDKWVPLTNNNGTNNLENYPIRPEYSFPGNEVIYKLPRMNGEYFFYINDRFPDNELDVFVLTDPSDASTAMMWMNGTGAKQYINANPNQDYYLVLDAFENVTATINFAATHAVDLPNVCIGSTDPIDINVLRTLDLTSTDITYSRLSGTGGIFDNINGIFTPDENTTTSDFQVKTNFNTPPMAMTENITIFMIACPPIPTLSEWNIIIISILLVIIGLVSIKVRSRSLSKA